MRGVLRLFRLHYVVPFALGYTLILHYARGGAMAGEWQEAWHSTLALALVIAAGYVFNDACDVEIDRVNSPDRPIASGAVSRRFASWLAAALAFGGLALAALCRWQFLVALAAVAAALALYDAFSKRLGAAKQLVVAALMVSLYPLAFAQAGGVSGDRAGTLALFPAWLFLTAFAYEILKDLEDVPGDLRAVARPNPLQREPARWRGIASAALLAGVPLAIAPMWFGCRWPYLAVAAPGLAAGVAAALTRRRWALGAVYVEVFLVAGAAAVDVIVSRA